MLCIPPSASNSGLAYLHYGRTILNATQPRVAWDTLGVWVWMAIFGVLFLVGLALIWWSSSQMQGST